MGESLYTAAQTRELDRTAIEDCGIPGYTLMCRAGAITFEVVRARYPSASRIGILCGVGNNAGDGYVIARLAHEAGLDVSLQALVAPENLAGDAATAYRDAASAGVSVHPWNNRLGACDVHVDALLGTGLTRPVQGDFAAAVAALNDSGGPVVAVDIPSGLDADSGAVRGVAVRADTTVTFIGRKRGLYTGAGPDHVGSVVFDDLGVPGSVFDAASASVRAVGRGFLARRLTPRRRTSHKGDHGRLLVAGGETGMAGAVRLAGEAGLRAGAGMVRAATRAEHAAAVALSYPALMSGPCESVEAFAADLTWCDAVVAGPGLGKGALAQRVMEALGRFEGPQLIDADGLNWLARNPPSVNNARVLTPHPGEAARLLDCSVAQVQSDRFSAAAKIASRYGGVCVLKGAGTLVTDGHNTYLCTQGNPGLATAGSGDVLSGVIGAMLASGMDMLDAATIGVVVHACAADDCARDGERGMTALDLLGALRGALNP